MASQAILIETGIPLPAGGQRGSPKYPFRDLGLGDSFFVPDTKVTRLSVAKREYEREGKRFVCRTVDDGVRVWRVA